MRAFIVELQNSPGSLAKLTEAIAERGINITNVVGATCGGSGSLGIITNDESSTRSVLDGGSSGYRFGADEGTAPYRGQGLRVPALPEVLEWLPDGVGIVIELKSRDAADATVAALYDSKVGKAGLATVISFDEQAVDRVRELDETLPTGLLLVPFDKVERVLTWAVEHRHQAVYPWEGDLGLDPMPLIAQATAFGIRLGSYVVNEPQRMQQLSATGLWGFVTDVPDVARAALGRAG